MEASSAIALMARKMEEMVQATQSVQEVIDAEKKAMADERAALESERCAWEAEKEAMSRVVAKDDDVIELSVGGRHLSTTRGVLLQEEVILHRLRLRRLTGNPTDWSRVKGPPGKDEYFAAFVSFLGLTQALYPKRPLIPRFGACAPGLSGNGGPTVTQTSNSTQRWAIGDAIMESGDFTWGFKLHNLPPSGWVCLGVIGVQSPPGSASDNHETSNGWGCDGRVWKHGVHSHRDGGWGGLQDNDEVKMRLKADEGILQMKVARLGDRIFEISGLGRHPWRVHANLYNSGSSVELMPSEF